MTRSQLFKAAHSMTRTLVGPGISYQATFGLVLRHLNKEAAIMTTHSSEIVEAIDVDAQAIALLPTLPTITGVSEKQVAYATQVRERKFIYMMRACHNVIAQDPASKPQVEAVRDRFLQNAKAKFWLDIVEDTDGGLYPQTVIARIARKMLKAGYVIPARADAGE